MSFVVNPLSWDALKSAMASVLMLTTSAVDSAPICDEDITCAWAVLIAAMSDVANDAICLVVNAANWPGDINETIEVMKHPSTYLVPRTSRTSASRAWSFNNV